jgi:arabinan endo-1,5-alpha-L-arabinosidase
MSDAEPAWPGYFADPFVLRSGGAYYAYGTAGPDEDGSARGMHFQALRSSDLQSWTAAGYALVEPKELRGCAYWAPEVAERDGAFHLYYSAGGPEGEDHRIRVARGARPEGPFHDVGATVVADEPFSIDAHPFRDPRSGRWYLFFVKDFFDGRVGSGIAAAPLADDMQRLDGPVVTILRATADWQVFGRNREWYGRTWAAWHTVEGPCVVYRNHRYWLFYSGGLWKGPEYGVSVAVADDALGPYVEEAPEPGATLLRSTGGRRGPGHNSIVTASDGTTDCIVYHAWDRGLVARRMFIDRLAWTPRGPAVVMKDCAS